MRYYFHLESDTNIQIDHWGKEFDCPQDAIDHGAVLARQLAEFDTWLGWAVRVIDAHNTELVCVPILDPIESK